MTLVSKDEPTEDVPLQEFTNSELIEDGLDSRKDEWCITKTKLVLLTIAIVTLLVVIIVLVVLFGMEKRTELKETEDVTPTSTVVTTTIVPTTPATEAWWNPRLPTNIIPKHYNLFLNITVDLPRFDGRVGIDIEVNNKTDLIILHNNGLNISSVQVLSKSGNEFVAVQSHFKYTSNDFHVIRMVSTVHPGLYILKIAFDGVFEADVDEGLYRQTFTRQDGQTVNFASTQFEPDYARRAFPCFDEPALKATFNVSIAHRPDYVALSNMPIYKTEKTNGQKIDYYKKTVTMSTYLLAFVVGDFKHVETKSKKNVTMRYYSRPSLINKTQYAASIGGKIMTFYEDHLGLEYSLPKEDQAAIPGFGGAMENWGIITYGEMSLLWDSSESTEYDRKMVSIIVAHELAHQWFGNIVTMKWWNDIWLNEGFATYLEHLGMNIAQPAWNRQDDMIITIMTDAFKVDGKASSNPIRIEVKKSSEIMDLPYTIYYNKAACIIRMMQSFLGEKTFLDGLKIYLKRHAFANAESDDLWRAMTEASCGRGKCLAVKQIMDTWILQMGYPVLTFKRINSTHYLVNQSRFLFDDNGNVTNSTYKTPFGFGMKQATCNMRNATKPSPAFYGIVMIKRYSWVIPFSYVLNNNPGHHFAWMNMSSTVIPWDGSGWIKANTNYKGFYITNYEESNWQALAKQLNENHTVLSPSDRAGILMDAFLLADGDKLSYSTAIGMTEYMTKETEYVPWKVLFQQLVKVQDILPRTSKAYKYLQKYLVYLGKHQYDRLGIQDTGGPIDKVMRSDFLRLFCEAQVKSCVDNLTERFHAWMRNPRANSIPPNLREFTFYHGIAHGGVEEWDFLYSQYNKTKHEGNKRNILIGLSASREAWIIDRYLSYTLVPGRFEKDDITYIFHCVSKYNPIGSQLAWNFVRVHWEILVNRFDSTNTSLYSKVVPEILLNFNNAYELSEVQTFHERIIEHIDDEEHQQPERIKHDIKKRILWLKKNQKEIEKTLESNLKKYNLV